LPEWTDHLHLKSVHSANPDYLFGLSFKNSEPHPQATFGQIGKNGPQMIDIWPIALNQPLPVVPVPLLPGDDDIPLDLQQVFTATYDLLGYDLAVDYRRPPEVALTGEVAGWAEELLQQIGLKR
jgi:hypothetical protein